jgi:hypothetical protein
LRIIGYVLVLCSLAPPAGAASQAEIDALRAQIGAPGVDAARAVPVAGLTLRAGPGALHLRSGRIYPAQPVGGPQGAPREFVFVGEGTLEVDPEDAIEAGQLEIYTGAPRLRERFSAAVLVIALDAAAEAIRARPEHPAAGDAIGDTARELLEAWRSSRERQLLGVEGAILADVLRDSGAEGYFAGAFEGERLGRFLYTIEPRAREQVTLGRFEPIELTAKERRKLTRVVHREQRRGRLLGVSDATLGQWNSWLSMPLLRDGAKAEGVPSFEPEHYRIDAEIGAKGDTLQGRVTVRLRATGDGSRVAQLTIHSDLLVTAAFDGEGTPAPFAQSGGEIVVVLARAPAASETIELELRYGGQAFAVVESSGGRSFVLHDTVVWHPHAGEQDLATYDVSVRWPKKWELLAPGEVIDEGADQETRWRRRVVNRPTFGYTLQLGSFETLERQVGDVRVVLAVDAASLAVLTGRRELLDWIADAVEFLSGVFGPLPTDELVVVTGQQGFSQAMLGFVTLSTAMTRDDALAVLSGAEDPRSVIAHEIAHQWWGHRVPWRGYRDQWLSEALANYSSVIYARTRLAGRDQFWSGPYTAWPLELAVPVASTGHTIAALGPVVLGSRLHSSLADGAYEAIVYTKGGLVLNLLSHLVQENNFNTILRWLAQESGVRALTTEDFLRIVADATTLDLAPFAEVFVYGTALPEVEYAHRAERADDGSWRLQVEVTRTPPLRLVYRVAAGPDGALDVLRAPQTPEPPARVPALVVPFAIPIEGPEATGGRRKAAGSGAARRRGFARLDGSTSSFEIAVPDEPRGLTLDPDHVLPVRFHDVSTPSKTSLWRWGRQAALAGDLATAVARFEQALAAEHVEAEGGGLEDLLPPELLDVLVALELARTALDGRDRGQAASWLERARTSLKKASGPARQLVEPEVVVVEARLALQTGDAQAAANRLERMLYDGELAGEGLLLLAVAARETGARELSARALDAAAMRRAEVAGLELLR